MLRLWILLCGFLYINHAIGMELKDASTWGPQLAALLKPVDFNQSFTCGSQAQFKELVASCDIACDETSCWSMCMSPTDPPPPSPRMVVNCTPDQFSLFAQGTGQSFDVPLAEFSQDQGSMIYFALQRIESWIKSPAGSQLRITSVTEKPFTLRFGRADQATVPAVQIEGYIDYPGREGRTDMPVILSLLKEGPGIARIARFRLLSETWFLLDDFQ